MPLLEVALLATSLPERQLVAVTHAVTLAQLLPVVSTVRALNGRGSIVKLEPYQPDVVKKSQQVCILFNRCGSILLDKSSPLHHCARNTFQLSIGSLQPRPGSLIHQGQTARH